MKDKNNIVTRFAPSPTGSLHLGGARTALFNYLVAKKYNGQFILRIEDTDRERSRSEYEQNILDGLSWLGLSYDIFARQSERTDVYNEHLEKLVALDKAYISKETSESENGRSEVIRLRNSGKKITFHDEIRGDISFDTEELGDFIIAKSMHEPLYHLAVVVDDNLMGVTHVIRGEDHISNTPRQMLIAEAIGAQIPTYAHLPLILAPDRSKLSKRHGAISVTEYREMGYLPEAIVNFLALLGWSPQGGGSNNEVLFFDDLIERFDLSRVGKSGAIFNIEKLNWINREHLKRLPKENIIEKIENALPGKLRAFPEWSRDRLLKIIPLLIERIVKFSDITLMAESGELDYYFKLPTYDAQSLIWKKDPKGEAVLNDLPKLIDTIKLLPDSPFDRENIEKAILSFIGEKDKGSILWPMRYALTGKERSPDPFTIASVIGKPATLERLSIALEKIKNANI